MNEAPKKIWIDAELDVYDYEEKGSQPYIRADIVDELVEALVDIRDYEFSHRYIKDIARTALAKLEESHDRQSA